MLKKKLPSASASDPVIYSRDQHTISKEGMDDDAIKIMQRLIRHGYKAYLVGGGVRDLLLGKQPKDFDISTDATPRRIKELFRNSRIIGRRFKLIHVFFKGNKIIEVSTFRDSSDSEIDEGDEIDESDNSPKKMPLTDNKFGTPHTDALRRDLTVNGLFYDLSTHSILDYVGGMDDLNAGIVRIIGDPDLRIPEDPVRMMRVIRHAVRARFSIDERTWDSVLEHREMLADVAPMRVYEEFKKDLLSGYLLDTVRLLAQSGILSLLMPRCAIDDYQILLRGSPLTRSLQIFDEIVGSEDVSSVTAVLALFVLFLLQRDSETPERWTDIPLDEIHSYISEVFSDLAVPRKERERIEYLLRDWDTIASSDVHQIRWSQFTKRPHLDDLFILARCIDPENEELHAAIERVRRGEVAKEGPDRRRSRSRGRGRNSRDNQSDESQENKPQDDSVDSH
jgi:poly(A) polymerase